MFSSFSALIEGRGGGGKNASENVQKKGKVRQNTPRIYETTGRVVVVVAEIQQTPNWTGRLGGSSTNMTNTRGDHA